MRCSEFHRTLNELLDERCSLESAESLKQHTQQCEPCRQYFAMMQGVLGAMSSGDTLATGIRLDEMPAFDEEAPSVTVEEVPRSLRSWQNLGVALTTAACLLLLATGFWFGPSDESISIGIEGYSTAPANAGSGSTSPDEAPPLIAMGNASESSGSDAIRNTAEGGAPGLASAGTFPEHHAGHGSFVHQPLISIGLLSQADWRYAIPAEHLPFGQPIPQLDPEFVKVVSDGMTPVQQSMNSTLDLIRRSFASRS